MWQNAKRHPAWIIAISAFMLSFFGMGVAINCLPLFVKDVCASLEISRSEFSGLFSIQATLALVSSAGFGQLMEKKPSRHWFSVVTVLVAAGFVALGLAGNLWELYAGAMLLGLGAPGMGVMSGPYLITNWFEKYRGTMISVVTASAALGGAVCSPLLQWVMIHYGWRIAFFSMAAGILVMVLPFTLFFVRISPESVGLAPFGAGKAEIKARTGQSAGYTLSEYFRTISGKLMLLYAVLVAAIFGGIKYHLPSYYSDLSYSAQFSATLFSVYMFSLIWGRLLLGILCDKFGVRVNIGFLVLLATGLFCLQRADSTSMAILASGLLGFSGGGGLVFVSLMVVLVAGRKNFSSIFGILNTGIAVGAIIGPLSIGIIFDKTGSYVTAWHICMALAAFLIGLALLVVSTAQRSAYTANIPSVGAVSP